MNTTADRYMVAMKSRRDHNSVMSVIVDAESRWTAICAAKSLLDVDVRPTMVVVKVREAV